jgi:hypothetical protein
MRKLAKAEVVYNKIKRDSESVGKLVMRAILQDKQAAIQDIKEFNPAAKKELIRLLESDPAFEDLRVNIGPPSTWEEVKRVLKGESLNDNILLRVPRAALVGMYNTLMKNSGNSWYNSLSHSVTINSTKPSIIAHELGHARDFATDRPKRERFLRNLGAKGQLVDEYQATKWALKNLSPEHKTKAEKELSKAMFTYLSSVDPTIGFNAFIGPLLAGTTKKKLDFTKDKVKTKEIWEQYENIKKDILK